MGIGEAGVLRCSGGLRIVSLPNRCFLLVRIALIFKLGIHSDSLFQLNLVARHIAGATKSLPSILADAVLCRMVGAECMRAALTVHLVLLQSE